MEEQEVILIVLLHDMKGLLFAPKSGDKYRYYFDGKVQLDLKILEIKSNGTPWVEVIKLYNNTMKIGDQGSLASNKKQTFELLNELRWRQW